MKTIYSKDTYKPAVSDFSHDVLKYALSTLKRIFTDIEEWTDVFKDEDTGEDLPVTRTAWLFERTPSESEMDLARSIMSFLLNSIDEMTKEELSDAICYSRRIGNEKFQEYYDRKFGKDDELEIEEEDVEDECDDEEDFYEDICEGTITFCGKEEDIDWLCSTIDDFTDKYGDPGNECGLYLPINSLIEILYKGSPEFFEGNIMSYERKDGVLEIQAEGDYGSLELGLEHKFPDAEVTSKRVDW